MPVNIKLEMGGTETQRILVVTMKRLAATTPLLVFSSRGRVTYSNTSAANMLGYASADMKGKDISAFLPQPFGLLHHKWLKELQAGGGRPAPGSCRNAITHTMVTSNGTNIPVHLDISAHAVSETEQHYTVAITKSTPEAGLDERRLLLRVNENGYVVAASPSPASLFGLEPRDLRNRKLSDVVDVFSSWTQQGNDLVAALNGFAVKAATDPGASWRVGVLPVGGADKRAAAAAADRKESKVAKALKRDRDDGTAVRPAVMQIEVDDSEEEMGGGIGIAVRLWAVDRLSGVLELHNGEVQKADLPAGLIFGLPHSLMVKQPLSKFVRLPPGASMDEAFGMAESKRGGMKVKEAGVHRTGPKKPFEGRHADGYGVQLSVQAAHKVGTTGAVSNRILLVVKIARAAVGSVAMVHRLIQEAQLGSSAQEADLAANLGSSALAPRAPGAALGATGRGSPVPGLNFSKLKGGADGGGGGGSATARRTDRSGAPATVTARGVELGIDDDDEDEEGGMALPGQPDKPGSGGGSGGDGPPRTITSPSDNTNDTAMTGKKKKGAAGGGASARPGLDELVSDRPGGKQSARVRSPLSDGDDGDSHDGDRRRGNGGMAVSSDEGDDDAEAAAAAARRKAKKAASSRKHNRPLTEEEQEAILEAKSKVKVKDWLARGYAAPGAGDEEVDAPPTDLAAGLAGKARGGGDEEGETSERSSEHASQIGDSASAVGGDFSRGKRLKRLTKLLSGRRAMSALYALRQHVWVVVAILLLAHLGCFLGVLMNLNQQKNAVEAIHAYGLAEAEAHSAASYGRAVEAALRGDTTFFGAGDLPELTNRMTASINAFEELHQGLYLGFGGLRPPDDADQKTVWDDDVLDVSFYDTATPPALTTIQDGLWSLGNNWLIAAREVVRLALLPGGPSPALGENRNFLFVRDNTPGALHDGYAANVQLELQKAETRVQALRRILVALMVVEGIIICLAATLYLFYVLYRVVNTRVALFTIFLVVPNSFVRSLALKSVNLASEEDMDGDGDEDGGGDKKNTGKGGDGAASGAAGKAAAAAGDASALATLPSADDASAGTGGGFGYMPQVKVPNNADGSRGKGAASGAYTTGRSTSTGFLSRVLGLSSGRVVNGKELVETGSDIYILCYPFLLWACLVIAVYAASYAAFANQMFLPDTINSASLMGATQRVLFYSNELVLQPAAERVATAATLSAEVAGLEHLYEVTLYGGTTNEELVPLGFNNSYDSSGSLFTNKAYPELLFRNKQCLRLPGEPIACVADTDAYYQVSFNALDPLVRRLLKEATFLVEDAAVDHTLIDATQPRFQYMWNVARLDLAGGMQVMSRAYVDAAFGKFSREQLLHIGVEVVSWLACGAFLLFMFRPFISVTMQESKRVAELLTQLPSDMDVEAMAERSWLTVMGYSLTESASKAKKTKKLSKKKRVSFWVWLMGDNRVDDGDDESDDVPPLRNRNGGGGGGGRNRGWVDEAPPRGGRRAGPAWEDEEDEEGGAYGRRSAPPPPRGSGMTPRSSARSPPGGSGGFSAKLAGHNADGHMLSHRSNGGGGASGGPAARDLDTPMGRRLMATPLSDRPPMSSGRERRRSVEFHDAPMPPSAPLASARSGASGGGTGRTRRRSVDFAEV